LFIAASNRPELEGFVEAQRGVVWQKLGDPKRARLHFEAALRAFEAYERLYPEASGQSRAGYDAVVHAHLGQREAAMSAMSAALELMPESKDYMVGVDVRFNKALMLTILGDKQQALDELAHQLQVPNGLTEWEVYLDPSFDSLRDEPRFQAMVANVSKQAKEAGQ
jgi:tetratricopeptide (TPR) repeat protein